MDSSEHTAPVHNAAAASRNDDTKNDAMEGVGGSGGSGGGISSNADLLRKIVEACSRHRSFHEERGPTAAAAAAVGKNGEGHGTNMPDRCRNNLSRLTSILPMVEASYSWSDSNAAVDVSHLCGFYNAVVVGAFCPHSLQLFDWGKEAREILPRVHRLYQYLASKSVIRQTISAIKWTATATAHKNDKRNTPIEVDTNTNNSPVKEPDDEEEPVMTAPAAPTIVSEFICDTIAQLFHTIPTAQIRAHIVRDLITTAFDLCALTKSGILDESPDELPSGHATNISISIFSATRDHVKKYDDNYNNNEKDSDEMAFTVAIPNQHALLALQAATFRILDKTLTLFYQKRMERLTSFDSCSMTEEDPLWLLERDSVVVPPQSSYLDDAGNDGDLVSTMLASIKGVLVSNTLLTDADWEGTSFHGSTSRTTHKRASLLLSLRSKITAARVLQSCLLDWERMGTTSDAIWSEVALLVSNATLVYATMSKSIRMEENDMTLISSTQKQYSTILSALLLDAVVAPCVSPKPSLECSELMWSIRCASVFPLMDSIPCMIKHHNQTRYKFKDRIESASRNDVSEGLSSPDRRLYEIVMKAIHMILHSFPSGDNESSFQRQRALHIKLMVHCHTTGIFQSMIRLLKERSLTTFIIGIITKLLSEDAHDSDGRDGLAMRTCHASWLGHNEIFSAREKDNVDKSSTVEGDTSSPSIASNKRRKTVRSGTKKGMYHHNELQIEHSPRRKKTDRRTSGDFSSSPPSSGEWKSPTFSNTLNDSSKVHETDEDMRTLSDNSIFMALKTVLDESIEYANRIINASNRPDKTLLLACLSIEKVSILSSTLRLVLTLDPQGKCDDMRKKEETYSTPIRIIAQFLFNALHHVAEAICLAATGSSKYRILDPDLLKHTMHDVVSVGLHSSGFQRGSKTVGLSENQTESSNYKADLYHATLQTFLDGIAACALSAFTDSSSLLNEKDDLSHLDPLDRALDKEDNDVYTSASCSRTSLDQSYMNSKDHPCPSKRNCKGICKRLCSVFGLRHGAISTSKDDAYAGAILPETYFDGCFCGFLSLDGHDREYSKRCDSFCDSVSVSVFESLPLSTKCILLACTHPVAKEDIETGDTTLNSGQPLSDEGPKYTSTLLSLCRILAPSHTYPINTAAGLASLPVLAFSLAFKMASFDKNVNFPTSQSTEDCSIDESTGSYIFKLLSNFPLDQYICSHACSRQVDAPPVLCVLSLRALHSIAIIMEASSSSAKRPAISNANVLQHSSTSGYALNLLFYLTSSIGTTSKSQTRATLETKQISCPSSIEKVLTSSELLGKSSKRLPHCPPHVRLAKWKYMEWVCRCASSYALRQTKVHLSVVNHTSEDTQKGVGMEAIESDQDFINSPPLLWFVRAAFSDDDQIVRDFSARRFGSALLGNDCRLLRVLFLSDVEWDIWCQLRSVPVTQPGHVPVSSADIESATLIVTRLFREIDMLLCKYCDVSQSQLSFTMVGTVGFGTDPRLLSSTLERKKKRAKGANHHISAIHALSSLCHDADTSSLLGRQIFEHALLRLIRFWASSNALWSEECDGGELSDSVSDVPSVSSICFGELLRLNQKRPLGSLLKNTFKESLIPALFSEILVPSEGLPINQSRGDTLDPERRYKKLLLTIRTFLLPTKAVPLRSWRQHNELYASSSAASASSIIVAVVEYVDELFPTVLPMLIIEEDYDALRMCAGFRLYLLGEKRKIDRSERKELLKRDQHPWEGDNFPRSSGTRKRSRVKVPGVTISTKDLEKQTLQLCLSPNILEHIMPRLLLHPDRAPLVFFLRTVVQSSLTLQQLFESRDNSILKSLVWELGASGCPDTLSDESLRKNNAIQALKKGALIREQGQRTKSQTDSSTELTRSHSLDGVDAMVKDAAKDAGDEAATRWVTSNFMYLLVNVVQGKWNLRSTSDKIKGMKCLHATLHFLNPSVSPQYIPQVMSTIDMAMCLSSGHRNHASELRLLATQSLAQFVRILMSYQAKTVGENLSTIVVALYPVLTMQDQAAPSSSHNDIDNFTELAVKEAVALMEWLVSGKAGRLLVPFFQDIPFLPPSPELDHVRSTLKSNGVDFDNLLVLTEMTNTENQHQTGGSTSRDSIGSSDVAMLGSRTQGALHRRLKLICTLVSHESLSVRKVVYRHLCDLLRANRALFQKLIANEEAASLRFLTVVHSDVKQQPSNHTTSAHLLSAESARSVNSGGVIGGGVTQLIQSLLTRCVVETEAEIRVDLATCLGEVGAIGPSRLGEFHLSTVVDSEGLDASCHNGSWRLQQPPWKSQVTRWELQLVTNHLVVALKAAPTSSDQHKIAFTIQELLILLDGIASLQHGTNSGDDKVVQSGGFVNIEEIQSGEKASKDRSQEMNPWLSAQLNHAGVLEIIEPFWSTHYRQVDIIASKQPPFFCHATSYYNWLSNWCRFMVCRSSNNDRSSWKSFFHACRSAIRSTSGITIAEFLFPLLILDGFCFGDETDEKIIRQEILDVLGSSSFKTNTQNASPHHLSPKMNTQERQKGLNAIFTLLDTLQIWAEREIEDRHKVTRGVSSASARVRASKSATPMRLDSIGTWPAEESIARIEDLLNDIPLSLCAQAAADVGMHARSLRFLELDARKTNVQPVYDDIQTIDNSEHTDDLDHTGLSGNPIRHVDARLLQEVLSSLEDTDTMLAVGQECCQKGLLRDVIDHIRERESFGDWSGAIQGYERALQSTEYGHTIGSLPPNRYYTNIKLEKGILQNLLELGQFESVLNQVQGIVSRNKSKEASNPYSKLGTLEQTEPKTRCANVTNAHFLPYAAQAAWRLGRWSTLDEIVNSDKAEALPNLERNDYDALYQFNVGRAMLGIHCNSDTMVETALCKAKLAVLGSLSTVARESYTRIYPHLLRLHSIREIEDACQFLLRDENSDTPLTSFSSFSEIAASDLPRGWAWDSRLKTTESMGSNPVVDTRLALSKLAHERTLEASLWLTKGNQARKSGLYHVAENSLARAECLFVDLDIDGEEKQLSSVQMQIAKLKHAAGDSASALRVLGTSDIKGLVEKDEDELKSFILRFQGSDPNATENFARKLLQATEWAVEGGLKGGTEVIGRYRVLQKIMPDWAKAHLSFAKYLDSLLESRITALASRFSQYQGSDDDTLWANVIGTDKNCQDLLLGAMQEYGAALQQGTKNVYQALPRLLTLLFDFTALEIGSESYQDTVNNQERANQLASGLVKSVAVHAFYTAMPQLISRITHRDVHTATVVRAILKRILTKFPAQAMWGLAWLRNSADKVRSKVGEDLFLGAEKNLRRLEHMKMHDLLVSSKSLFKYLIDLASYQPKNMNARVTVRSWKGDVELSEFVPPIQAALSVSPSSLGNTSSRDAFPAFVPRMRSFSPQIQVMSSKARPKKLTAFAIPSGQSQHSSGRSSDTGSQKVQSGDIGEMHFLVKKEAKGDLRKDARVQDLNNVINRLLAGRGGPGSSTRQKRKLQLRTFSVVCLSEDCGILEWVPNTESLRNLVSASYNPQAAPHSIRRRGKRISNFSDENLRNTFTKCQNMYIKNGHLIRATSMFEELCLKSFPPLLYWWFINNFLDPHAWFEARSKFTLSAAVWSGVGHVIGLGDRHSENILVDTTTGDCVHVDFDCIFDKGLNLPRPEVVPFRLTQNMVDVFGPTGTEGMYSGGLKTAMTTLRDNRDTLLSVLEPFLKDPVIDWKRHRAQQNEAKNKTSNATKNGPSGSKHHEIVEAKRSIKVIDERLKGVYNLRNPNHRKIRRKDGTNSVDQHDEMSHILPLSVEGQVNKMIQEATSSENLLQLYVGWMPWL